jgi:mannonate dehydratase
VLLSQEFAGAAMSPEDFIKAVRMVDTTKLPIEACTPYSQEEAAALIGEYRALGEEGLWKNLELFLKEIIPVALRRGVNMAIHPDDPEWPVFELPRIITNEENLGRLLSLYDDSHNGLVMCNTSLGCSTFDDYARIIEKYVTMGRVHYARLRDIRVREDDTFFENVHCSPYDTRDMVQVLKVFRDADYSGYGRFDHRRMIAGETAKPNFNLYDRVVGTMYLTGILVTLESRLKMVMAEKIA